MKTLIVVFKGGVVWTVAETKPKMWDVESFCRKMSQQYGDDFDIRSYHLTKDDLKDLPFSESLQVYADVLSKKQDKIVYTWDRGWTEYGEKVLEDDINVPYGEEY